MELHRIHILIESFRKEMLGAPQWVASKQVFEYEEKSVETVVLLKLVRAAHGLSALQLLCRAGLFIDMGSSIRCLNDCIEEVFFLLESYPKKPSVHVEQFIKNFFEGTIDGYLDIPTHQVQRDKIRSAFVRVLKGGHDDAMQKLLVRVHQAFCGYTHASYAHIMEIYEGSQDCFDLDGVPSEGVRRGWAEHFELACSRLLGAGAFAAQKFGKPKYFEEMMRGVT